MTWLIGVDEAGYGPNLGPLAIAACVWRVADADARDFDLYERLAPAVVRQPCADRLAIADSKLLYKPGKGLGLLEHGVLTALTIASSSATDGVAKRPTTWLELLAATRTVEWTDLGKLPWHDDFDPPLPLHADAIAIAEAADRLRTTCGGAGATLIAVRVRLIFPAEFNELVAAHGTKGAALSCATLALVRRTFDDLATDADPHETFKIVCDKHGGRNHYAGIVQRYFPETWVAPQVESRAVSRYRCDGPHGTLQFEFRTGGEEALPAALASMAAKYIRELAMRAFNAYWTARIPGLRPTAGYPGDAKRFLSQIASTQRALGIPHDLVWRSR